MAFCGLGRSSAEGLLNPTDAGLRKAKSHSLVAMQHDSRHTRASCWSDSDAGDRVTMRQKIKNTFQAILGIKRKGVSSTHRRTYLYHELRDTTPDTRQPFDITDVGECLPRPGPGPIGLRLRITAAGRLSRCSDAGIRPRRTLVRTRVVRSSGPRWQADGSDEIATVHRGNRPRRAVRVWIVLANGSLWNCESWEAYVITASCRCFERHSTLWEVLRR